LTRLKVFYVLLVFRSALDRQLIFMAQFSFQQEFQILKDVSLGASRFLLRCCDRCNCATASSGHRRSHRLYHPRKPVPRFEYVLGKIAGVLLLLAISTLVMKRQRFCWCCSCANKL